MAETTGLGPPSRIFQTFGFLFLKSLCSNGFMFMLYTCDRLNTLNVCLAYRIISYWCTVWTVNCEGCTQSCRGICLEMMLLPTAMHWLSASLLMVTIIDLSLQRHGVASATVELKVTVWVEGHGVIDLSLQRHGVVSATVELQAAPLMPSDLDSDVDKRRFMFGRRDDDAARANDLWNDQTVRRAASRRRWHRGTIKPSDVLPVDVDDTVERSDRQTCCLST